ncbi:MAG: transcription termination factor NusA [Candidatus Calescibacterium sp.]|nr:transcription termination factor NusA [Candidatus Calescibacterium sp.]MCX7971944.1 transcription termination factor NusA [bacterium]MDW8195470.1 transcription termination factor NusA [Candidatus Calescibacterium sp.]
MQTRALLSAIRQLSYEKGIPLEKLIDILSEAISKSFKKKYKLTPNVKIEIVKDDLKIFIEKEVVKSISDGNPLQITLKEAQKKYDRNLKEGDKIFVEANDKDFSRSEAIVTKQLLTQKIKELEYQAAYEEITKNLKSISLGTIRKRDEKGNVWVEFEKALGVLPIIYQVKNEPYYMNKKMFFLIINLKEDSAKNNIVAILNRKSPLFVKKMLEKEYNEIKEGNIEIVDIARQAGYRTKVIVRSKLPYLDPVSTILGPKNFRIQTIVNELNGERIDVILYSEDPKILITRALGNVKILSMDLDYTNKVAKLIVPDEQLSIAIGREGYNAKLTATITKWKIDIKSESAVKRKTEEKEATVFEGFTTIEEYNEEEIDIKNIPSDFRK